MENIINNGVPMKSPLASIIADLVMQELERVSIESHLNCIFRFVDNIVIATQSNNIEVILNTFNSFHRKLNFTVEIEGDRLDFLNVTLINKEQSLIFDWYKPVFFTKYLNFRHLICHKIGPS